MRRSLNSKKDSLDLLLDTICNMFGSIILITLLIVVISSNTNTKPSPIDLQTVDRDETQRRIQSASEEIDRLKDELAEADPPDETTNEITKLQKEVEDARQSLASAKERRANNEQELSVDYAAVAQKAATAAKVSAEEIVRLENAIDSDEKRIEQLKKDIAAMAAKIEKITDSRTQKIRLPRERSTGKSATPVIFIYNEIFPVYERDISKIGMLEIDEYSTLLSPKKGRGYSRDPADVKRSLDGIPSGRYAACYVFPDSIEAFRVFRNLATAEGMEIGWQAAVDVDNLVFTSKGGSSPKPQ